MYRIMFILLAAGIVLASCRSTKKTGESKDPPAQGEQAMAITISSPAFADGGMIPVKYTCDGEDISPQLTFDNVPPDAKSLALVADDPDAPMGTWVHWVMYNLPPDTRTLPENVAADEKLAGGAVHGITDFGRFGYGGPCPPSGTHRYYFKLYALDTRLDLPSKANKKDVVKAMEGHILAQGELMGKYKRR
jgi:Raf kinase inhibitor-like YbhB/YbcL family protein